MYGIVKQSQQNRRPQQQRGTRHDAACGGRHLATRNELPLFSGPVQQLRVAVVCALQQGVSAFPHYFTKAHVERKLMHAQVSAAEKMTILQQFSMYYHKSILYTFIYLL